jgi:curved DNA-binding protein CbpA
MQRSAFTLTRQFNFRTSLASLERETRSPSPSVAQFSTTKNYNPFHILGVPPSSSYQVVQKAFHKLALEYHPDTSSKDTSEHFVRIRKAFENIRDGTPYSDKAQSDSDLPFTEQDFLNYFWQNTGIKMTSVQRRELVHLYRSRIPGAYYGGQMYDLAHRVVHEQDAFFRLKKKGTPPPPPTSTTDESSLRRKRKR